MDDRMLTWAEFMAMRIVISADFKSVCMGLAILYLLPGDWWRTVHPGDPTMPPPCGA